MSRALLLSALLVGCTGSTGSDSITEPNTVDDGGVRAHDAAVDARVRDSSTRDARVSDARVSADAEAGEPSVEDAEVPPPKDSGTNTGPVDSGMMSTGTKKPVFVAVGYSGRRMISRDLGLTWTDTADLVGKDDDGNLLRAVAFGKGVFVAAGWNIWTSPDGATWTKRDNPSGQWMGGMAFGNNLFVGAGGSGTSVYSSNGINWSAGKDRNSEPARSVAFGDGRFVCGTDPPNWWTTADGNNWSLDSYKPSTNQVVWCDTQFSDVKNCNKPIAKKGAAYGMGIWVAENNYKIQRSTDNGASWTDVKDVSNAGIEDIAFGMVE